MALEKTISEQIKATLEEENGSENGDGIGRGSLHEKIVNWLHLAVFWSFFHAKRISIFPSSLSKNLISNIKHKKI